MIRNGFGFILLLMSFISLAQTDFETLTAPQINISYKLNDEIKLNVGLASRQTINHQVPGVENNGGFNYIHTDFSIDATKNTGLNNKLQVGYILRCTPGETFHRIRQRFTIVRAYNRFVLSHRFGADQTFSSNRSSEYRLRYRIAPELPLNGLVVDPREFYLKITSEIVGSLQNDQVDIEYRGGPNLGYVIRRGIKIEVGCTYRYDQFIVEQGRHRLFLGLSGYARI